ncbi:MAG: efflux RND transporter permease subunit [Gammaproteobacteria bacterium]
MKFTDHFIKRPVMASVVSILIFIMGLYCIYQLPLREYPKTESTMISVTTSYSGASADLVQGFITTPLTQAIAGAEGIDYMTASSTQGVSTISVYMRLNYDPNAALAEIMSKVQQVQFQLPSDAEDPVIQKQSSDQFALMYIGFNSTEMSPEQVTDYLTRVVVPKLESVDGVAQAEILGGKTFSMRVWLNPTKMASYNITASTVKDALQKNNYQSAAGQTKGQLVVFNVKASTDVSDLSTFNNIVVKSENGTLIRMRDIAKVELGSQSYDSSVVFDGHEAVFIGIYGTPSANPLSVINGVRQVLPELKANYPEGMTGKVVYDGTRYIKASLYEVIETIVIAALIVIVVIFMFLGSLRTVLIPVITMPLSMVGVCFIMYMLDYSLNLLTLLAMVLAIGLVVDDAIVVVENIYRHIEEGKDPIQAALIGAREIASPVISMTITLAAVYAPIGFMTGLTGQLFTEFAFTLAGSVILSGVIALTLSPMMCSKVLSSSVMDERFVHVVDHFFDKLKSAYHRRLVSVLNYRPVTVVFAIIILASCYFLATTTQTELAPKEDESALWVMMTGPMYANIDYMNKFVSPVNKIYKSFPQMEDYFYVNGAGNVNSAISGMILKSWDERKKSVFEIQKEIQPMLDGLSGVQAVAFNPSALPGSGGGMPVQFVIKSTGDYKTLFELQNKLLKAAEDSGMFAYVDASLRYNNPQLNVDINRDKAGEMGINMQTIGSELSLFLSGNYTNWFSMSGRSYQVIPQVERDYRFNPKKLEQYYIANANGDMVPLSSIATLTTSVEPNALSTFQQLNSATVQGVMVPGHTVTEGLQFLRQKAAEIFPHGYMYDYAGESRQVMQEGSTLVFIFFFALVVIYLVLAAKFESWRDPFVILISVPMSICGALIPLNMGVATLNIYTGIGLVTLIGLISKHGILIVEFANNIQRDEGLSIHDAVIKSAALRLRPVLMTTFAMIFGVVPLILAGGAGAKSRFGIGIVIFCGMAIGTLFTLFVVPTVYTFLAQDHRLPEKPRIRAGAV